VSRLKIVDFVGTNPDDNLLINAEARAAMSALADHRRLAGRLVGRVKLAYLDPPYNTGRNFIHYRDNLDPFTWNTNLKETLEQVRRFLADDGSVWLHLDDAEQHRARLVLDEVFGPENFVASIIWGRTQAPRTGQKPFAVRHDYIHVYRKSVAFQLNSKAGQPVDAIWPSPDTGLNEHATAEGRLLFGEPFATPKPELLLKRIIELTTFPDDLVLDCYAGSGTTPAVAHKLGRRWLAIETETATVQKFLKPRLQQVVAGSDQGGVSAEVGWSGGAGFTHLVMTDDALRSTDASRPV